MKDMILSSLAGLVALLIGLSPVDQAQAQSYGAADAPASQARAALPVQTGKILDIKDVQIEVQAKPQTEAIGGLLGAGVGAYLAKDGQWQGQALAGALGAFAGTKVAGLAGHEMRDAHQIIVKLDNGQALAVIQEPGGEVLKVGQLVYLVGQYPAVRVVGAK